MKNKFSFKKNLFHNNSFVRAPWEEQSESIENHYNLQFVFYQILNEQEKNKRVRTILSLDFEMVGFQVIGETVHYFLQVVDEYSCKKTKIVQVDQQTEDVHSFFI